MVVEDVEVGYLRWIGCRGCPLALPLWIPACAGMTIKDDCLVVWKAVLDELLCCVHAVADFDAGGFALHCAEKELCDGVSILGEADDVLL